MEMVNKAAPSAPDLSFEITLHLESDRKKWNHKVKNLRTTSSVILPLPKSLSSLCFETLTGASYFNGRASQHFLAFDRGVMGDLAQKACSTHWWLRLWPHWNPFIGIQNRFLLCLGIKWNYRYLFFFLPKKHLKEQREVGEGEQCVFCDFSETVIYFEESNSTNIVNVLAVQQIAICSSGVVSQLIASELSPKFEQMPFPKPL